MSRLSSLRAKPVKCLFNGVEMELSSLTVEEMASMAELQSKNGIREAVKYLIFTSVKKAIPDATDDEINNMDQITFNEIMNKLLELNGLAKKKEETPLVQLEH